MSRFLVAVFGTLLSICGVSACAAEADWIPPGPTVGTSFPALSELSDQRGKPQSLKGLLGTKGLALMFVRSADWCPFCKKQLADVNARLAEFQALGFNVVSISHDEVPLISAFAQSQSIAYTMLADPNGAAVEQLGIRDMQYADGSKAFGVARPMIFILDRQLKITHKFAEESYRSRPDLTRVLAALRSLAVASVPGASQQPDPWMVSAPPPLPKGAIVGVGGVEARTAAPDGLGETTSRAATAGVYDPAAMTYVPWKDATVIRPLQAGAQMPADSAATNARGERVDLNAAVARQPTVLIFYRGGWCPYCNAHLRDLQKSEAALKALGYQILAISPDTPAQLQATAATGALSYTLLSDPKLTVAEKFGLRYELDERYIAHVKAKPDERAALAHVDLEAQTGGYMLTPGAFILDRTGKIHFAYANNNYSVRLKQDVLLAAARSALEAK